MTNGTSKFTLSQAAEKLVELYKIVSVTTLPYVPYEPLSKAKQAKGLHQWKKFQHIADKLKGKHSKHISFTAKNDDGSTSKHELGSAEGNLKFLLGQANPGFHMAPYHWQIIDPSMSDEEAEKRAKEGYTAKQGLWGEGESFEEGDVDDGKPHHSFSGSEAPKKLESSEPEPAQLNPNLLKFFNAFQNHLQQQGVDPSKLDEQSLQSQMKDFVSASSDLQDDEPLAPEHQAEVEAATTANAAKQDTPPAPEAPPAPPPEEPAQPTEAPELAPEAPEPAPAPKAATASMPAAGATPDPSYMMGPAPKGTTKCPFGGGSACKQHAGDGAYFHKLGGSVMQAHMEASASQGKDPSEMQASQPDSWGGMEGYHFNDIFFGNPQTKKVHNKETGAEYHWNVVKDMPLFAHHPVSMHMDKPQQQAVEAQDLGFDDALLIAADDAQSLSHSTGTEFVPNVYPMVDDTFPPPGSLVPMDTPEGKVIGVVTPESVDFYDEEGNDVSIQGVDGQFHAYLDLTQDGETDPTVLADFAQTYLGQDLSEYKEQLEQPVEQAPAAVEGEPSPGVEDVPAEDTAEGVDVAGVFHTPEDSDPETIKKIHQLKDSSNIESSKLVKPENWDKYDLPPLGILKDPDGTGFIAQLGIDSINVGGKYVSGTGKSSPHYGVFDNDGKVIGKTSSLEEAVAALTSNDNFKEDPEAALNYLGLTGAEFPSGMTLADLLEGKTGPSEEGYEGTQYDEDEHGPLTTDEEEAESKEEMEPQTAAPVGLVDVAKADWNISEGDVVDTTDLKQSQLDAAFLLLSDDGDTLKKLAGLSFMKPGSDEELQVFKDGVYLVDHKNKTYQPVDSDLLSKKGLSSFVDTQLNVYKNDMIDVDYQGYTLGGADEESAKDTTSYKSVYDVPISVVFTSDEAGFDYIKTPHGFLVHKDGHWVPSPSFPHGSVSTGLSDVEPPKFAEEGALKVEGVEYDPKGPDVEAFKKAAKPVNMPYDLPPGGTVWKKGDTHIVFAKNVGGSPYAFFTKDLSSAKFTKDGYIDPPSVEGHEVYLNSVNAQLIKKLYGVGGELASTTFSKDQLPSHITAVEQGGEHFHGEKYPSLAPLPGSILHIAKPFQSLQKGVHEIVFHSGTFKVPADVEVPGLSGGVDTYGGKSYVYSKKNADALDAYLKSEYETPLAEKEMSLLSKKQALKVGDTVTMNVENAASVMQVGQLPIGTKISIDPNTYKSKTFHGGDWVKVGPSEWKKVYASGNKGGSVDFSELAAKAVSHYGYGHAKLSISHLPSAQQAAKLAAKAAKKAKKAAAKVAAAGGDPSKGVPGNLVHWDDLVDAGIPHETIKKLASNAGAKKSNWPTSLPPPGTSLKVESKKYGQPVYLLFGASKNVSAFVPKGDGSWKEISPYGSPAAAFKDVMAHISGQMSITHSSAMKKAGLHGIDFSKIETVGDLHAKAGMSSFSYAPCVYGGGEDCKKHGGDGAQLHKSGYVHKIQSYKSSEIPENIPEGVKSHLAKFSGKSHGEHWAPAVGSLHIHTDDEGKQTYLASQPDGLVLFNSEGKIHNGFPWDHLKAHEGVIPGQFDPSAWGLSYAKAPKVLAHGHIPAGVSSGLKKLLETMYHKQSMFTSVTASPTLKKLFGDDFNPHSVFIQESTDGTAKVLIPYPNGNGFFIHNENGDLIDSFSGYGAYNSLETAKKVLKKADFAEFDSSHLSPALEATKSLKYGIYSYTTYDVPEGVKLHSDTFSNEKLSDVLKGIAPEVGTLMHGTDSGGEPAWFIQAGSYLQSFNKYGTNTGVVSLDSAQDAIDFYSKIPGVLNYGSDPETSKDGVLTYAKGEVPSDAPATVIGQVFSDTAKKTKVSTEGWAGGMPEAQKLHVYTGVDAKPYFVYAGASSTKVFSSDGQIKQVIWPKHVTPKIADEAKQYGLSLTPNKEGAPVEAHLFTKIHAVPDVPKISELNNTGVKLGGGQNPNEVYTDTDGQKWLWKPLPSGYHHFVVHAESSASKLAAMALGDGAVYADVQSQDGTKGTLQKVLPDGTTLLGKSTSPEALLQQHGEDAVLQLISQHPLDWFISNHDTHGNQFLLSKVGDKSLVVGIDKGQSFKHFPSDELSLTYFPNGDMGEDGPYHYRIWDSLKSGSLSIDKEKVLQHVGHTIAQIKAISDQELESVLSPLLQTKFSNDEDRKEWLSKVIERKNSLKSDFEKFLHKHVYGEKIDLDSYTDVKHLDDLNIPSFPSPHGAGDIQVQKEEIPAEYEDKVTTEKISHMVQNGAFGKLTVKPHNKVPHLVTAFAPDAQTMQDFLTKTGLKTVGNEADKHGNPLNGIKPTAHGVLAALHKDAYEGDSITKVEKVLKKAKQVKTTVVGSGTEAPTGAHVYTTQAGTAGYSVPYVPMSKDNGFDHVDSYNLLHVIHQDKKIPKGGVHALVGSMHMSGTGGLTVKKLYDEATNQTYYEASMKLPKHIRDAIALTEGATEASKRYSWDEDLGVYHVPSAGKVDSHYGGYMMQVHSLPSGVRFTMASKHAPYVRRGDVTLRIPEAMVQDHGFLTAAKESLSHVALSGAPIDHLGELIQAPTEESLYFQKLKQASWSRLSHSNYSSLDFSNPDVVGKMEHLLEQAGTDPSKLQFVMADTGHMTVSSPGTGQKLFDDGHVSFISTNQGHIASDVMAILKSSILSPKARIEQGITKGAALAMTDWHTGGANSVFSRLDKFTGSHSLILDPKILDRVDLRWSPNDIYGCTNPKHESYGSSVKQYAGLESAIKKSSKGSSGNELFVSHSIPATAFLGIVVDTDNEKNILVSLMKKEGMHTFNGMPAEEFVVVGGHGGGHVAAKSMTAKAMGKSS